MTDVIKATCEKCQKTYQVKATKAGNQITCPKCGGPIDVPDPELESFFAEAMEGDDAKKRDDRSYGTVPPKPTPVQAVKVVSPTVHAVSIVSPPVQSVSIVSPTVQAVKVVEPRTQSVRIERPTRDAIQIINDVAVLIVAGVFFLAACGAALEAVMAYAAAENIMQQICAVQIGTVSAVLFVCFFLAYLCAK